MSKIEDGRESKEFAGKMKKATFFDVAFSPAVRIRHLTFSPSTKKADWRGKSSIQIFSVNIVHLKGVAWGKRDRRPGQISCGKA